MPRPPEPRPIADLIAAMVAASPMETALSTIANRRARLLAGDIVPSRPSERIDDMPITEREPMPALEDTEAFAAGFWQRLKDKEAANKQPPLPSKPRLVVDNDNPEPPKNS